METIRSFNRDNLKQLNSDIQNALDALSLKYGISLKAKNCKFSIENFQLKIVGAIINNDIAQSIEYQNYNRLKDYYCIHAPLGFEFTYDGRRFKVAGLNPKCHKYPIICTSLDGGKGMCTRVSVVNYKFQELTK